MARASQFDQHRDKVLACMHERFAQHSKPPSVRELAELAQVSVSTMHGYLARLNDEGMIEWRPKHHRSLTLTPAALLELSS